MHFQFPISYKGARYSRACIACREETKRGYMRLYCVSRGDEERIYAQSRRSSALFFVVVVVVVVVFFSRVASKKSSSSTTLFYYF